MKDVSSNTFDAELSASKLSIVDFWAPWCVPCRKMLAVFDEVIPEIRAKFKDQVSFLKVDVDQEAALAQRFGITMVPTIISFVGTVPHDRYGGRSRGDLLRWIETLANEVGLEVEEAR